MPQLLSIDPSALGGLFTLPGTDKRVQRMGYGAMQLAGPGVWGPPRDRDAALAVLREAVDAGIDHIDTADFYGPYVTNKLICEALHPYSDNLLIATKIGATRGEDGSWNAAMSPSELTQAVHDNLRHLHMDVLDLVYLRLTFGGSGQGPREHPIEEPLSALATLQEQGLVRHIGLSNATATQVEEARRMVEVVSVQNMYNLAHRHDDELINELAEDGVAYVPYFPLGGFSPLQSTVLSEVAATVDASPLQVALAWLLKRAPNVLLIPGTSSVAHFRENMQAASLELPPEALARLNAVGAQYMATALSASEAG